MNILVLFYHFSRLQMSTRIPFQKAFLPALFHTHKDSNLGEIIKVYLKMLHQWLLLRKDRVAFWTLKHATQTHVGVLMKMLKE